MNGWNWFRRVGLSKKEHSGSNRVIQAIEIERSRISRELHDSIGQALYSVLVGVKIVSQLKIDDSVKDHFLQVEQLTAKALDEVKRMAHDLHPPALDELGLVPAIRVYLERFEYTFGIRTRFIHEDNPRRYDKDIEIVLYRICQEALTNAAKYAETNEIEITLIEVKKSVRLIVQDFGKGFQVDRQDSVTGTGIGLVSIKERVQSFGGETTIRSQPGMGTTIDVTIPFMM